jgi:hypothetical protein
MHDIDPAAIHRGADISDCTRYRYRLWRWWNLEKPLLGFIMLNPSTADAYTDDPTIRKCAGFAQRFGYGGVMVTNLFDYRATSPSDLKEATQPISPDNDTFLSTEAAACVTTICAWGNHGAYLGRSSQVLDLLQKATAKINLKALTFTKEGQPGHPLYLPYTSALQPMRFS